MSEKSERDAKIIQSYLESIKAKTGKNPADLIKDVKARGFAKNGEIVAYLKTTHGLGHGHANLLANMALKGAEWRTSPSAADPIAKHVAGPKAHWRATVDAISEKARSFGADVTINPNATYINLNRGIRKFGIIQVSAADRLDVGIKCKALAAAGRLEASGAWNAMVTHRVRIAHAKEANAELFKWLKQAYDAAA